MTKTYCDLCGNEFDRWPEIALHQVSAVSGTELIPERFVPDIHLHYECLLALGLIRYQGEATESGKASA